MGSPPRDRDAGLIRNGTRLLVVGLVMIVVGLALTIPLESTPAGIGLAIASLGSVPFVGGLGLLLSGLVARRSRAGKPFA
jgi:hypothetical protein